MDKSINWPFHDFILNLFGTWAYTTVLEWELTWTCWILKWFLWKKAEYCTIFFGTVWVGFVPAFGRWGYWISAGHCGCISCLSLFCIHRKQAGVPPVTLASHIKELWLKIWDRWGSIRISDIYFAPERCIWCCSSLRWCFFFSLTWTQRSKSLRLLVS